MRWDQPLQVCTATTMSAVAHLCLHLDSRHTVERARMHFYYGHGCAIDELNGISGAPVANTAV